jgi:hypothetical protein
MKSILFCTRSNQVGERTTLLLFLSSLRFLLLTLLCAAPSASRAELNFPIGPKQELDFTQNKSGTGLRWEIPYHLLDAFFYASTGRMSVPFEDSKAARAVLDRLKVVIDTGCSKRALQRIPHLVLLNRGFYSTQLKPLLAEWLLVWLAAQRLPGLRDEQALQYMTGQIAPESIDLENANVSDDYLKMLNLSKDWLNSFLPFVLEKIDRVTFGLLTPADLARALALGTCYESGLCESVHSFMYCLIVLQILTCPNPVVCWRCRSWAKTCRPAPQSSLTSMC